MDSYVTDEYDPVAAPGDEAAEYETEAWAPPPAHISLERGQNVLVALGIFYLLIGIGMSVLAMHEPAQFRPNTISLAVGVFLILAVGHIIARSAIAGRLDPFSLDVILLGSFLLYAMGIWVQCLFGLIPYDALYELPAHAFSSRAALLSTAAVAAFLAGYVLRQMSIRTTPAQALTHEDMSAAGTLGAMGFSVFSAGVAFRVIYIFGIIGAGEFFRGRYITTGMEGTPELLYRMAEMLARLGVIVMAVGYSVSKHRLAPRVFWPVYGTFLLLLLVDGERGAVFQSLLALVVIRHILIKPIKWRALIIGALVLMFVFASVRVARMMETRSLTGLVQVMKAREEGFAVKTTLVEAGHSSTTIARTMRRVPDYEGYKYGKTVVPGLLSIIPGASGVAYRHLGGVDAAYYVSPATWLTWREAGRRAPTSGLGFSSVAEAYLNFGAVGVPLVFLLAGFILRGVEYKAFATPSLLRLALLVVIVGNVFYWTRSSLDYWFRPIVWTLGLVWIGVKFAPRHPVAAAAYEGDGEPAGEDRT